MTLAPRSAWRVFPWDPRAADGDPWSPRYVPPFQGHGRFDLRDAPLGVLYLAESPAHAIAEKLQDLRNQSLEDTDLFEGGHRYALAEVQLAPATFETMVDLCDPPTILERQTPPDHVAALTRTTTQALARKLYDAGGAGFRWWSTFFGEWHTLVIFADRLADEPSISTPRPLHPNDPDLQLAARFLGIALPPR